MKAQNLFDDLPEVERDGKYSYKVSAPLYQPKHGKPHPLQLVNSMYADSLEEKILKSNVSDEEKTFLLKAAKRHIVFNFSKIADYYAHSSKEMQGLMEDSALVIVDFNKAIERGFVVLQEKLQDIYDGDCDEK
jgi:hypothetical protein